MEIIKFLFDFFTFNDSNVNQSLIPVLMAAAAGAQALFGALGEREKEKKQREFLERQKAEQLDFLKSQEEKTLDLATDAGYQGAMQSANGLVGKGGTAPSQAVTSSVFNSSLASALKELPNIAAKYDSAISSTEMGYDEKINLVNQTTDMDIFGQMFSGGAQGYVAGSQLDQSNEMLQIEKNKAAALINEDPMKKIKKMISLASTFSTIRG